MSAHFGQPLDAPCGTCSFCLGEGPFELPDPVDQTLDGSIIGLVEELVAKHPVALNTPRAIARFLCGIRSPALSRARLSGHPSFGTCEQIPFDQVMNQIESKIS